MLVGTDGELNPQKHGDTDQGAVPAECPGSLTQGLGLKKDIGNYYLEFMLKVRA